MFDVKQILNLDFNMQKQRNLDDKQILSSIQECKLYVYDQV